MQAGQVDAAHAADQQAEQHPEAARLQNEVVVVGLGEARDGAPGASRAPVRAARARMAAAVVAVAACTTATLSRRLRQDGGGQRGRKKRRRGRVWRTQLYCCWPLRQALHLQHRNRKEPEP